MSIKAIKNAQSNGFLIIFTDSYAMDLKNQPGGIVLVLRT